MERVKAWFLFLCLQGREFMRDRAVSSRGELMVKFRIPNKQLVV